MRGRGFRTGLETARALPLTACNYTIFQDDMHDIMIAWGSFQSCCVLLHLSYILRGEGLDCCQPCSGRGCQPPELIKGGGGAPPPPQLINSPPPPSLPTTSRVKNNPTSPPPPPPPQDRNPRLIPEPPRFPWGSAVGFR